MVYRHELIKVTRTRELRSNEWPHSKQKICPCCKNAVTTKYNRLAIPVTVFILIAIRHIYSEVGLNLPTLLLILLCVTLYVEKRSRFVRDE